MTRPDTPHSSSSQNRWRLRVILTVIALVVAALPLAWYAITQQTRNAPIALGSGTSETITDDTPVPASTDGSIPTGTPPRDLLMITDRAGDWDIILLDTDGTLTNLTADATGTHDLMPTWSFDGETINFLSNRGDPDEIGPTQITADRTIRPLTVVTGVMTMFRDQQFDWDPTWSPDGSEMIWVSVRDLNLELYRIAADQAFEMANAQRLTQDSARDWFAAWSPDGTQIVYNNNADGNEDIFLLDLATDTRSRLTTAAKDDVRGLWSLDGTRIAFATERDGDFITDGLTLYVMNPDGSDQRPLRVDDLFEGGAVTSQGGMHVAYLSNRDGSWQVYVMNADGSNLRRVTDGTANYLLPVWRP